LGKKDRAPYALEEFIFKKVIKMANWQRKLSLKDIYHKQNEDGFVNFTELAHEIASRLGKLEKFNINDIDEEKERLIQYFNDFSDLQDCEDFDFLMSDLYDWADTSLNGIFAGKKVCWVETF
jgi:hypothetical protein